MRINAGVFDSLGSECGPPAALDDGDEMANFWLSEPHRLRRKSDIMCNEYEAVICTVSASKVRKAFDGNRTGASLFLCR